MAWCSLPLSLTIFTHHYSITLLRHLPLFTLAWLPSIQLSPVFLTFPLIRALNHRGIWRPIFHAGSAGLIIAVFLTSFCRSWWSLLLVQGVLTGASAGCVFNAGLVLVEYHDDKKARLRMGLATAGPSVGGIVYAIMAGWLIERVGFR
ncbi:hypothetical protein LTS18_009734 [Coniosporium uncinatum]|uniref:Uncharacterized protein n=1 Tax=Coniosporium uncinatum TaxID=93489 RepID=A0ACC3DLQ1_9PEZI|nr:hypothetical protein LTS18_009734 [Coniosporium uncinatum]